MTEQQMTPHQALSFLCSAIRCGEVFDGHHSQAAEIIRGALSHAEREAMATAPQAAVPEGWRIAEKKNCFVLSHGNNVVASLAGPDAEANAARIATMLAAAPTQVVVPEGWKLVPVEPTDDMISAGADATNAYRVDVMRAYDAMLAAAPDAPIQPDVMDEPAEPGDFEAMQRGHEADLYDDVTNEQVGNLVALVRRLSHAFRNVAPNNGLPAQAADYLDRIGLPASPLRTAQQPVSDPDGLPSMEDYQSLCAALYQACGAYNMPERIMDVLSKAQPSPEPFRHLLDDLLPVSAPDEREMAAPLVNAAPDLLEELEEAAALLHCGCNHPACRQCVRDKRWQETIGRAIGRQSKKDEQEKGQ